LINRIVIFLLIKELVSVLLNNLALNLGWELGVLGDLLGLHVQSLLHESVDLDVVFHLIQLDEDALTFVW
jgi:hypothetical protein